MAFAFGGIGPWEVFSATLTTVIVLGLHERSRALLLVGVADAASTQLPSELRRPFSCNTCVVTAIVFFVRLQIYESAHAREAAAVGTTWYAIPLNIRAPMYVNPFFFLTASFAPPTAAIPGMDHLRRRVYRPRCPCRSADFAQPAPPR